MIFIINRIRISVRFKIEIDSIDFDFRDLGYNFILLLVNIINFSILCINICMSNNEFFLILNKIEIPIG